jgi:hypothetical protein
MSRRHTVDGQKIFLLLTCVLGFVACDRQMEVVSTAAGSGWYLLIPPVPSDSRRDRCSGAVDSGEDSASPPICAAWRWWEEDRSLSQWPTLHVYDSAKECLEAREQLLDFAGIDWDSKFSGSEATQKQLDAGYYHLTKDLDLDEGVLGIRAFEIGDADQPASPDKAEAAFESDRWREAVCVASNDPRLAR